MEIKPEMIIGLLVFMLGHLGGAIWFASRVNTQMRALTEIVKQLSIDLRVVSAQDIRIAVIDQRLVSIEQRIRDVRDMIMRTKGENNEA